MLLYMQLEADKKEFVYNMMEIANRQIVKTVACVYSHMYRGNTLEGTEDS